VLTKGFLEASSAAGKHSTVDYSAAAATGSAAGSAAASVASVTSSAPTVSLAGASSSDVTSVSTPRVSTPAAGHVGLGCGLLDGFVVDRRSGFDS